MYFFLITLENHIPIDIAKPPINKATTTLLTPSQIAVPAAAPAPIVHKGQCAFAKGIKKIDSGAVVIFFIEEKGKSFI